MQKGLRLRKHPQNRQAEFGVDYYIKALGLNFFYHKTTHSSSYLGRP